MKIRIYFVFFFGFVNFPQNMYFWKTIEKKFKITKKPIKIENDN